MEYKKTILIADRNPRIRDLLKRELISAGYFAYAAKNAAEAESAVQHSKIDAVIIDPDLPGSEVSSVFESVQNHIPPLPIIALICNGDRSFPKIMNPDVFIVEKGEDSLEIVKNHLQAVFRKVRTADYE